MSSCDKGSFSAFDGLADGVGGFGTKMGLFLVVWKTYEDGGLDVFSVVGR